MTPIKLDANHLLGFDRRSVASAKIGIPKKHGSKVGLTKTNQGTKIGKSQSAKIGATKIR